MRICPSLNCPCSDDRCNVGDCLAADERESNYAAEEDERNFIRQMLLDACVEEDRLKMEAMAANLHESAANHRGASRVLLQMAGKIEERSREQAREAQKERTRVWQTQCHHPRKSIVIETVEHPAQCAADWKPVALPPPVATCKACGATTTEFRNGYPVFPLLDREHPQEGGGE